MKICVFGLWHLGLTTVASLGLKKHDVVAVDLNKKLIKNLNENKYPIYEKQVNINIKKFTTV